VSIDYDSPWKEALDAYFEPFLALLFPEVHRRIDWSRGYESLDKEFQQVVREAEVGRRYVDKLVKVWTTDGAECWVLVHVEVQTARDAEFPKRMYVYNYRVFDRYNRPVASLAVLADDDPDWRPTDFRSSLFGCEAGLRFPAVKLLDLAAHEAMLEASANPFAQVVLAHLKALQTHGDPAGRHAWKVRLVRGLYERGFSPKDVRELFRLIDWLMVLPPALNNMFWEDVDKVQEERRMPFVMSIERVGHCRGLRMGIESLLRVRFGEEGLQLMPEIQVIYEEEKLQAVLTALETAASPDEVRRLWAPG
jgi:predicted DNA-binding ribbon-helix-helix protein